jgi:TolB-like protein
MKFIAVFVLFIFTFFAIFDSWAPLFAQQKAPPKLTLGVIPLKATGVQDYEAVSLSSRLHSELVNTKQFRVVETDRINEVLREIGFQQYGFCTDEECAAKVGNMLDAQWMVTGSVGKIGQTYLVDVRMIDVETRQVFLTASRDFVGQIDGLLPHVSAIAKELAANTAHRLKYGSLEITSQPTAIYVYIDGELK